MNFKIKKQKVGRLAPFLSSHLHAEVSLAQFIGGLHSHSFCQNFCLKHSLVSQSCGKPEGLAARQAEAGGCLEPRSSRPCQET